MLGSASFSRAQIKTTLDVVIVFLKNATVVKGEILGFSCGSGSFVAGGDPVPYCHLEYSIEGTNGTGQVLFEQGTGQNSPRGLDGKMSVVLPRIGRGMKFYLIAQWA